VAKPSQNNGVHNINTKKRGWEIHMCSWETGNKIELL